MVITMNKTRKENNLFGQLVDQKALKMRMETLLSLVQDDSDGLLGYIRNRPELNEATGLDRLMSAQDTSAAAMKHHLSDMRTAFTEGSPIPPNALMTSHSHLARSLRVTKDHVIQGLPTPIGAGRIGCCMTCAASPRAHLSARYATLRTGGSKSEPPTGKDGKPSTPDYDDTYDEDPWVDVSSLSLLVPVLHWVNKSDVLRPRVSLVCLKCFDFASANTEAYMKRIDTMAALIPTKAESIAHPGRNKDRIMRNHKPNFDSDTLGKKKMLRLCQRVPELEMLVKITKKVTKHDGRKDEVKHIPVLAMSLPQATTLVNRFASKQGLTLLEYYNSVMNPKDAQTDSGGEEE